MRKRKSTPEDICLNCKLGIEYQPIKILKWKYGADKEWKQEIPCLSCQKTNYYPIFNEQVRKFYALCKICDKTQFLSTICRTCGYTLDYNNDHNEKCRSHYDINGILIDKVIIKR